MKRLLFLALLPLLAFQADLISQTTQPTSTRQLEVRVQGTPINETPPQQAGADKQNQNDSAPSKTINQAKPQEKERTLSIIKPDAVKNRHIGDIISKLEDKGLRIVAMKMINLDKEEASDFYHVHRNQPFFSELVDFMSSGPIVVMVLEGNQAIAKNREIMGATNPKNAAPGTIRSEFAQSMRENAVHGSDSAHAAREEIDFFFDPDEIYSGQ
jgi:nucleoside diphosphate kinase